MADWTAISGYTPQDYTDTAIFEVDADTKKIALITGQALVAGEENSQYIKFLMPRYWDGIDIKDKAFYIEYALAGQYYGKTAAVNAEYNTEQVRFGWVVPKEACCISGTLLFVLRIESTDYVLKTQIAEHPVFKSVNVEDVVPEPTKEAWYREFEARVETAISDAEAALVAAQEAQTAAENAAQNAQTAEDNAEAAAAAAQIRYGSPLTAAEADQMTEENRVYVYTGSGAGYTAGNWYYYDGSAWASGGVYNGTGINTDTTLTQNGMAADAKATGDEISQIKEDFNDIEGDIGTLKGLKYLNSNAITLLATILESAVYDSDMSSNIQALVTELNGSPFAQTETLVPIVTGEVNSTTFAYSQGTWQSTFVFEAGEIRGGLLRFVYDSSIAKKFNAVVYILDENDNPLKWTSYYSPDNLNVQGEWTPKYSNAGEGNGYSQTIDSFSVQIPSGCRAFVWVRAYYETVIDGVTVTDVQGSFRSWAMNGGITVTVEG